MNSRTMYGRTDNYSIHSGATLESLSTTDDDCDERSCYSNYTIETDATFDSCSIYTTEETIEVTYIPADCKEYFRMQVMHMMKKQGWNGNADLCIELFQQYLIDDAKRSTSYFDSYVKYPMGREKLLGLFRTYMEREILEGENRKDCIQGVIQREASENEEEDPMLGRNIVVYDIFQESASTNDMDKLSYATMFDTTGLRPKLIPDIMQVKESTLDESKKCIVATPLPMGINIAAEKFILSFPKQNGNGTAYIDDA